MRVDIPSTPGTYILWLFLKRGVRIEVGRLGTTDFKRGWYAYVGSAFGPGGLAARLGRHLRLSKKQRWHIDYLRASADVREIWYSDASVSQEHIWANALNRQDTDPILGFGCSDCRCPTHLFFFTRRPGNISKVLDDRLKQYKL